MKKEHTLSSEVNQNLNSELLLQCEETEFGTNYGYTEIHGLFLKLILSESIMYGYAPND